MSCHWCVTFDWQFGWGTASRLVKCIPRHFWRELSKEKTSTTSGENSIPQLRGLKGNKRGTEGSIRNADILFLLVSWQLWCELFSSCLWSCHSWDQKPKDILFLLKIFLGILSKQKVKQTNKQANNWLTQTECGELRFLFTSVSVHGAFNGPALSKVSESIEIHKILICTLLVLYFFFTD